MKPRIVAYLSPFCGWTRTVLNVFNKHELEFEYRDVARNSTDYEEMVKKTGQYSSPCVEIDGHMLADVGGDEVEAYLREKGLLQAESEVER